MNEPELLQATLCFKDPDPVLREVVRTLEAASDKPEPQTAPPAGDPHEAEKRLLNRYVVIASHTQGMPPKVVWVMTYHRVFKRTGVHPVVESAKRKAATHLETLFDIEGGFEAALEYLTQIIEKYADA